MTFTVVWRPDADNEQRWFTADSEPRRRISGAIAVLENALRHRPTNVGELNLEGLCIAIPPPVTLHYSVLEEDRLVEVLAIHFD